MHELLTDERRATLRERRGDLAATPVLDDRIQRPIARRRRIRVVAALATTGVVLAALAVVPGLLTEDDRGSTDRPEELASHPDAAPATDPTHALFTTHGGGLVAVELGSGTRTDLVPDPDHAATVIDLTVAAGSSLEDFTAIAFDDGTGPIGFITYVRRDGSEVRTSFTPNDGRLPGHSTRGFRTISPDGRWLAYHGLAEEWGVGLVPIDGVTGELDTDGQRFIAGLDAPVGWTGPVSVPGDRSVVVHTRHPDGRFIATVLERTADGFDVLETVPVDLGPIVDPDGSAWRRHAFGSLRPGELEDTRFDLRIEQVLMIGELARPAYAVIRYRGPDGRAEVRFALSGGQVGNVQLAAQARTALLTVDSRSVGDGPGTVGEAWVVRAGGANGRITLAPRGPLAQGVVSGALLGGSDEGDHHHGR